MNGFSGFLRRECIGISTQFGAKISIKMMPSSQIDAIIALAFRRGSAIVATQQLNPYIHLSSSFTTDASSAKVKAAPDPRYVNLRNAPAGYDATSAVVYPGFLTDEEGKSLIKEAGKRLKRRRFEDGHWDAVIKGYREVELSTPNDLGLEVDAKEKDSTLSTLTYAKVIEETRRHLANNHFNISNGGDEIISNNNVRFLPCHAIDLSANGMLSAHVDSVKFSGDIVAGISLLSDTIMRLRPSSEEWDNNEEEVGGTKPKKHDADGVVLETDNGSDDSNGNDGYVDLYLPQLSLYVLSGMSRYSYTHELLPHGSTFEFSEMNDTVLPQHNIEKIDVIRGRRLSIIFRDEHRNSSKS